MRNYIKSWVQGLIELIDSSDKKKRANEAYSKLFDYFKVFEKLNIKHYLIQNNEKITY
jgi:hypothetical protein